MSSDETERSGEEFAGEEPKKGVAWVGRKLREVEYTVVDGKAVVEGCIILGAATDVAKLTEGAHKHADGVEAYGAVITGPEFRWPNGRVPFRIAADLPRPERVREAIAHWQANTSIRFVELTPTNRTLNPNFVTFRRVTIGCGSAVGMQGGEQFVDLADNCTKGNVIHEIGHAVGLWHEQSRSDRNAWVKVDLGTVERRYHHNFLQHIRDGDDVGAYDYGSIMHYPPTAFSSSSQITLKILKPETPGADRMGQREALSAGDIATVKALYG